MQTKKCKHRWTNDGECRSAGPRRRNEHKEYIACGSRRWNTHEERRKARGHG
jgi:hypothetical protein